MAEPRDQVEEALAEAEQVGCQKRRLAELQREQFVERARRRSARYDRSVTVPAGQLVETRCSGCDRLLRYLSIDGPLPATIRFCCKCGTDTLWRRDAP